MKGKPLGKGQRAVLTFHLTRRQNRTAISLDLAGIGITHSDERRLQSDGKLHQGQFQTMREMIEDMPEI
jgi:hypothetical protein